MNRKIALVVILISIGVIGAGIWISIPRPKQGEDNVYQIGTLDGLMQGDFSGRITVAELLGHGSVGLGTYQGLDGEMVVIDGACYRVADDGSVERMPSDAKTPFASVSSFTAERTIALTGPMNYTALQSQILARMDGQEGFVFIMMHGTFDNLTVRSVPGQVEPYPPLADVIANQSIFYLNGVTGTLIGIYSPPYVGTIDQAGFHFHFISDDRQKGGHLLDLLINGCSVELDEKEGFELDL